MILDVKKLYKIHETSFLTCRIRETLLQLKKELHRSLKKEKTSPQLMYIFQVTLASVVYSKKEKKSDTSNF